MKTYSYEFGIIGSDWKTTHARGEFELVGRDKTSAERKARVEAAISEKSGMDLEFGHWFTTNEVAATIKATGESVTIRFIEGHYSR